MALAPSSAIPPPLPPSANDVRVMAIRGALVREGRPRLWALLFCMALPLLWDGVPFAAVGLPRAGGYYAMSFLVVFGLALFTVKIVAGRIRPSKYHALAFLITATFILTSVISGLLFFHNPIGEWSPELVYYAPCLLIFLLQALDIRLSEICWGVALAAATAAILVSIDLVHNLTMMDSYLASSGFDNHARRLMILKNETGLAVCLGFAWLVTARSIRVFLAGLIIFSLTFFVLIQVIETRLVIGGAMLAMAAFLLTIPRNDRKLFYTICGIVLLLLAGPLIFGKYITQLETMSSLADDGSVKWRMLTVDNYQKYFDQTSGLGFGIMSIKKFAGNILSFSLYDAPALYGIQRGAWSFFLADTSYYGALFQFGYAGLILTVSMTAISAYAMIRYGLTKGLPYREPVGAAGFFVLFLIFSPWPSNLFTLPWSILSGNMLFSLAARASLIWHRARTASGPQRRGRVHRGGLRNKPQAALAPAGGQAPPA